MKLEEIKKDIGVEGLDNEAFRKAMINDPKLRSFYKVQMCIQFLKGDYLLLAQTKPGSKKGAAKTVYGPVVRKLTDEELDRLVEACFFNVNEGV